MGKIDAGQIYQRKLFFGLQCEAKGFYDLERDPEYPKHHLQGLLF